MFASHKDFKRNAVGLPIGRANRGPEAGHENQFDQQPVSSRTVLSTHIDKVKRYRDFCRIEAIVTVTFQYHPSLPARTERLLTSVPFGPLGQKNNFRQRLIDSAINLSVLMHRAERGGTLRII